MSNPWITIDPVFSLWPAVTAFAAVFAFMLWREFKRKLKFPFARVVSLMLIGASILGLLLRPSYYTEENKGIILLTRGYERNKVDSLIALHPEFHVMHSIDGENYHDTDATLSYFDFEKWAPKIRWVLGEGLPGYVTSIISGGAAFQYLPGPESTGIIHIAVPQDIRVNRPSIIKGTLRSRDGRKTLIRLIGPAGVEDSVTVEVRGTASFELKFTPKQPGLFVYSLQERNGTNEEVTNRIPVEVVANQKLKILFLQKFPTAEVRYLKNQLADRGHQLTLRYQTSKTNFRYEYVNSSSIAIDRLTEQVSQSFDILAIDTDVLKSFTEKERIALDYAVHEGLGVLVMLNDVAKDAKVLHPILPVSIQNVRVDTVRLRTGNDKFYTIPAWPVSVSNDDRVQFVVSSASRALAGYIHVGAGKVGFQLLKETYRIGLSGNSEDHAALWVPLLEQIARRKADAFKVSLKNSFPIYPNEPLRIEVITAGEQPAISDDHVRLSPIEDDAIDDFWTAISWASRPGWHQLTIRQDSTTLNYFVSDETEWQSVRASQQRLENQAAQMDNQSTREIHKAEVSKLIPALLFFILFVLASGLLWLIPRI